MEAKFLDVSGRQIRYFTSGHGPPLVLVHGLGGSATNWCELAPLLAPRHRLVIPDLPGHAGSEPLPAVTGLQSFADCVFGVMEHEDAVPAPAVGHSLGGLVALRLVLRYPDTVSRLVLGGSGGMGNRP